MTSERGAIRVAVIGGGIAGLSAAFRLRALLRAARTAHEIVVYEQQDTCGGTARTDRIAGFSLDHGPNGWLSNEPLMARLIDELGLGGELVRASNATRRRFVFTRNKLHRLPASAAQFLTSGLLRPWEKLRVLGELFAPGRRDDEDETIYEFGRRRLGRGFTESILDPIASGVMAGDVHRLSLPAMFPKLRSMELEHGGLAKALLATRRAGKSSRATGEDGSSVGPAGELTTLRGGVGRLSETLTRTMATHLRNGCAVRQVTREHNRFAVWCDGSKECFDAVVVAVPAHRAARIVEQLVPAAARSLAQIGFANVAVVCHAYDLRAIGRQLDGFGHLIPRRDGIRALGSLWTSCIFPCQAPPGTLLLRTILGGSHDPGAVALSDDELIDLARRSTATTLGIAMSVKPLDAWIFRHPMGIPQYTLGHRQRVADVERASDELPGLAFVGASYRGASLNRCIRDAYTVAPCVLRRYGIDIPLGEAAVGKSA